MQSKYLFQFGYTWPAELERSEKCPDSDLVEDSSLVFVSAEDSNKAEALGRDFVEVFVRELFGLEAYSWNEVGFASWISNDQAVVEWAEAERIPVVESHEQIPDAAKQLAERARKS